MKPRVAIIGAGATGRGFLARLLQADGAELVFLDRDSGLIAQLNEAGRFTVYVGSGEAPCAVEGYEAFAMDDCLALERAAEADYLFVSVGEQNLKSLAPFFTQLAAMKRPEDMRVVVPYFERQLLLPQARRRGRRDGHEQGDANQPAARHSRLARANHSCQPGRRWTR